MQSKYRRGLGKGERWAAVRGTQEGWGRGSIDADLRKEDRVAMVAMVAMVAETD